MRTVTVRYAKTHLCRLIDEILSSGEGMIIERAGAERVHLVPEAAPQGRRKLNLDKGKVRISGDFDAPLVDFEDALLAPTDPAE